MKESRELRERISALETEKKANDKAISQLKDSLKEAKIQNDLLLKKMEEEKAAMEAKRLMASVVLVLTTNVINTFKQAVVFD